MEITADQDSVAWEMEQENETLAKVKNAEGQELTEEEKKVFRGKKWNPDDVLIFLSRSARNCGKEFYGLEDRTLIAWKGERIPVKSEWETSRNRFAGMQRAAGTKVEPTLNSRIVELVKSRDAVLARLTLIESRLKELGTFEKSVLEDLSKIENNFLLMDETISSIHASKREREGSTLQQKDCKKLKK